MTEKEKEFLIASKIGNFEYIQFLLTHEGFKKEININVKSESGRNALLFVAKSGRTDIASYLLTDKNLDTHINMYDEDNNNENCLQYACNYWNTDMIKFLIINMNMKIADNKLEWLKEFDSFNNIPFKVESLIKARDLHQKLDSSIDSGTINKKNSNGIKI